MLSQAHRPEFTSVQMSASPMSKIFQFCQNLSEAFKFWWTLSPMTSKGTTNEPYWGSGANSLSLSILTAIFQGTKDNGSGGDNWIYKTCKDPVKSSPTNRHPTFYRPDTLPVATNSVRALKRKYHISGFSYFCNILHECWTFTLTYNCPVLLNGRCSSLLRVVVSEMTYIYCVEWDVKL